MKRILAYITFVLLVISLSGCGEKQTRYKIGVSQCSSDDWRHKMNEEIDREIMMHDDATVEIRSAEDDNARQISDIKYFVDNGFDIIIVSPNEAEALTPVIKEVYDKGIPIVIFDRNINGDSYTARIGADDEGLGRSAAHYGIHLIGTGGNALEIYGRRGSSPAIGRHNGFDNEFKRQGGKVLASVSANWKQEEAEPIVDSLLKLYPETQLIFAHNDRMAIGAANAAHRMGRDDIRIIGIDAAPEIGIKAVADSVLDATFLYPTEGHRVIRTALAILKNEPFARNTILPTSSAVDLSNADILLLQYQALKDETSKIKILKGRIDEYWALYSSQTSLFYASLVIIILLFGVAFLLLRAYWQRSRHQKALLTQNRLLEEERDKQKDLNDQLEKATRSKLTFFTNVSHDLRTPLTLISEPVAMLAEGDNLTPQQHKLLKMAEKNIRILRRLINQVLDFRKYENDKMTLNLMEIDFSSVIRDWMESFHSLARKRDIRLTLDAPKDEESLPLALDSEKMERVFFNLLSNAFKYTPDNGSITVSYSVENDNLVLKVSDTGEGISERDLGNIFDRFYQADRVHPRGSGIGLSLAKAFIELHGGSISVQSTLGKGSVFTVTIPVRHLAREVTVPERTIDSDDVLLELENPDPVKSGDAGKPIVLVVDDNRDIQSLVAEVLGNDYILISALNGKDGVRMAAKYVPDVIVCDMMMPVMDGLECCRRIKSETSTSHIPVMMLTACSLDEQKVEAFDSGADAYLSKPFSASLLKARIASLIANRKRIRELWKADTPTATKDKEQASGRKLPVSDIDNDFYRRFLEIFNENIGNPNINVDKIASIMNLERSQFYRKIKALTNYAPVELMRRLRLQHARNLITTTEKSISEIAYGTGFSTPAYFTKCYRDAFGETPSETRSRLS